MNRSRLLACSLEIYIYIQISIKSDKNWHRIKGVALRWLFFLFWAAFLTTTSEPDTLRLVSPRLFDVCLFIYIQSHNFWWSSSLRLLDSLWVTEAVSGLLSPFFPPHTDATNLKHLVVRATQHSGIHYFILGFIPHEINSSTLTLCMTSKGFCRRQRNKITLTPFKGGKYFLGCYAWSRRSIWLGRIRKCLQWTFWIRVRLYGNFRLSLSAEFTA